MPFLRSGSILSSVPVESAGNLHDSMVTFYAMGHEVSISRDIALFFINGLPGDTDSNLPSLILHTEHEYHTISLVLFDEYSSDVLDKSTKVVVWIVYDS